VCVEVVRLCGSDEVEVLYLERGLSRRNLTPRGTPGTQGDTYLLFVYCYG